MRTPALATICAAAIAVLAATMASGALDGPDRQPAHHASRAQLAAAYGALPLAFEPNMGQSARLVRFLARGRGYGIYLTRTEAVLALQARSGPAAVVRMRLVNPVGRGRLTATSRLPGRVNYLVGSDPSRWRRGVRTYGAVVNHAVYRGIDLVFHGNQGRLEYDFRLQPGAAPARIGMTFPGARDLSLAANGDLLLALAQGTLRQHRPVAYQTTAGRRRNVRARFTLDRGRVGFRLGRYDHSRPVVIDPTLAYSTFLGGTSDDIGYGIAVDSSGAAYVAGSTTSTDFPPAAPLQPANGGGRDAFVAKLAPGGNALVYSTYLGGAGEDVARAIAVDAAGAAYVVGYTFSTNFPTARPLQAANSGDRDAFLAKLSPSGGSLAYSTYLGGTSSDSGFGVAVDTGGAAYATGSTTSSDFPTASPLQAVNGGDYDAFVAKIDATGTAFGYSTYLGGSQIDQGLAIAVDSTGAAYVTGNSYSANFPTASPLQPSYSGAGDAIVSMVKPAGTGLGYSTYLGGTESDVGIGIAVDSAGAASVTGQTFSPNFPTTVSLQPSYGGGGDAFISKVNAGGGALAYSTYLGGSTNDGAVGIALDPTGAAVVTGTTQSTDFPTLNPVQATYAGAIDAFLAKLKTSGGGFAYSTYLGGASQDLVQAVAVDAAGAAYVTGVTTSSDFPTAQPFQPALAGIPDAFVAKLGEPPTAVRVSGFQVLAVPSGVRLRWHAAFGGDLLGFDVYRERAGKLTQLNRRLIPAVGAHSSHTYVWRARSHPGAVSDRYWLEEVGVDGSRRRHGPAGMRTTR